MSDRYPTSSEADILLLLEGTFPFVSGGVSAWVYNLINAFPQYKFGAIFLGGVRKGSSTLRFTLPKNLVHLEAHYLFEDEQKSKPKPVKVDKQKFDTVLNIHEKYSDVNCQQDYAVLIKELSDLLVKKQIIQRDDFLYSKASWEYIVKKQAKNCPHISFLDYFWAIRNMHFPLWKVINIAKSSPKTKILHSVSTGYAGFLGALIQQERNYPFVLSEHGIYVKERKIDLLSTQWPTMGVSTTQRKFDTNQYITNRWIQFFVVLARFCYASADPIVSLFSNYRQQQINDGAPADKTMIIPNGVPLDLEYEKTLMRKAPNTKQPVIAIVARVVPIKDIKTFISAMVIVTQHIPEAQAWIIGPTDEDKEYFKECQEFVNVLSLNKTVYFKGMMKNVKEILPKIDLIVLSSISEGLPLVLLEGFAAGIPAVATDVGACRELIEGRTEEDKKLGASGLIVEIANPRAMANGIVEMIENTKHWQQAQQSALERIKKFYSQTQFVESYSSIYQKALASWQE